MRNARRTSRTSRTISDAALNAADPVHITLAKGRNVTCIVDERPFVEVFATFSPFAYMPQTPCHLVTARDLGGAS